jgi:hypothetical protein
MDDSISHSEGNFLSHGVEIEDYDVVDDDDEIGGAYLMEDSGYDDSMRIAEATHSLRHLQKHGFRVGKASKEERCD